MTTPRYRYGIIGTGRPHGSPGAPGFGMAHPHLHGFQTTGRVDLPPANGGFGSARHARRRLHRPEPPPPPTPPPSTGEGGLNCSLALLIKASLACKQRQKMRALAPPLLTKEGGRA